MSIATITLTQSTIATALTTHSGPPPQSMVPGLAGGGGEGGGRGGGGGGSEGGGGGGGGGAAAAPAQPIVTPHGNGKLEGKEPTIFMADQAKANEFMHVMAKGLFLHQDLRFYLLLTSYCTRSDSSPWSHVPLCHMTPLDPS